MKLNEILRHAICEKAYTAKSPADGVTVSSNYNTHHDQNCGRDIYRFVVKVETSFTLLDTDRLIYSDIYDIKRMEAAENIYNFLTKDIFAEIEKIIDYAADTTIPEKYHHLPSDLRRQYMYQDKIRDIIMMCSQIINRGV